MTAVDPTRVVVLDRVLSEKDAEVLGGGAFASVFPKNASVEAIYKKLRAASPYMKVYRKDEIPTRFHYRSHSRIAPIICVASEHAYITMHEKKEYRGGTHGYDNALPSMRALFIAKGPAFKTHAVVPAFENIHLYSLMSELLHLEPAPSDGSASKIRFLMRR
jgi:predicted AlkP superfamily pyrophosphatase or phosphodiesterase